MFIRTSKYSLWENLPLQWESLQWEGIIRETILVRQRHSWGLRYPLQQNWLFMVRTLYSNSFFSTKCVSIFQCLPLLLPASHSLFKTFNRMPGVWSVRSHYSFQERNTCLFIPFCWFWKIDHFAESLFNRRIFSFLLQSVPSGFWSQSLCIKFSCIRMQSLIVKREEFLPQRIPGGSQLHLLFLANFRPSWVVLIFMSLKMALLPSLMLRKRMKENTCVKRESRH